jgi:hypothetical protein
MPLPAYPLPWEVPSLLCRFYLHFKRSDGRNYVVMGNWLPEPKPVWDEEHKKMVPACVWEGLYDLKGCRDDKTLMSQGKKIEEVHPWQGKQGK